VRSYSSRAVFIVFLVICVLVFANEIIEGLGWDSAFRLGQTILVGVFAWPLFWKRQAL
jgi:hypothetical protein